MSAADFSMPFGKYKGTPVGEIPRDYLRWLQDNVELRPQLAAAIRETLEGASDESSRSASKPSKAELQKSVDRWYDHVYDKFGPGKGYSDDAILVVEYAKQQLELELGLASLPARGGAVETNMDNLPF